MKDKNGMDLKSFIRSRSKRWIDEANGYPPASTDDLFWHSDTYPWENSPKLDDETLASLDYDRWCWVCEVLGEPGLFVRLGNFEKFFERWKKEREEDGNEENMA